MSSIYQIRRDIIGVCKRIYARGYVASNDGNVSVRVLILMRAWVWKGWKLLKSWASVMRK